MSANKLRALVIVFVACCALAAWGCRRCAPEKRREWMLQKLTRDLELTESQQGQLDQHKTELLVKAREVWAAHPNTFDELGLQLRKDTFDQGRIQDIMSQNAARRQELSALLIASLAEFHRTLSPAQRTILANKIEKMNRWRKHHWRSG